MLLTVLFVCELRKNLEDYAGYLKEQVTQKWKWSNFVLTRMFMKSRVKFYTLWSFILIELQQSLKQLMF